MVLTRCFEPPDFVEASLAGLVTPEDQRDLVAFARAAIRTAGSVRVLITLIEFAGWRADAAFDSDALWLRDDEGVSRIAVVGDPAWKATVLTVLAQPIRQVPIAYFSSEDDARRWLTRSQPSHFEKSA
jgi:hypothetical protein